MTQRHDSTLEYSDTGAWVRHSDYTKLGDALRLIRRQGSLPDQEIAEAALLSAGETL